MTADPDSPLTGTTVASLSVIPPAVCGSARSRGLLAFSSSGGFNRTSRRLSALSQECPYGAFRSRTIRVMGGLL